MLPVVVIRNSKLRDEVFKIVMKIADESGSKVIRVVRLDDECLVIVGDRACIPHEKLQEAILSNPAIYIAEESFAGAIIVDEPNDLKGLENELLFRLEVAKIYSKLPKLNCRKCGYASCLEFAIQVAKGERKIRDCPILSMEKKVILRIRGKTVFLTPWVEKLLRSVIFAFLENLKGADIRGTEKIILEVRE